MRDNLYITLICSGQKYPTTTFYELQMLLIEISTFSRAQPIMSLYNMNLVLMAILCSYDWAIYLSLVAWVSLTSSPKSSGQFISSCSRISNTYVQDITVSMALGEVSNKTSVFGFALSSLAIFHGDMILMKSKLSYLLQENVWYS